MVTSVNQADFIKTALRLPPDLHARLHEAAAESGRSYNAEIVARLQQSFEGGGVKDSAEKLFVAGFVLRMVQNTVPDAEIQADIATMAKYISNASEEDQSVAAFDAIARLQRKQEARLFAALKR